MLQLIGTFLPVYGALATLIAILVLRGFWRWAAAILIPLITFVFCWAYAGDIAENGNLLFVALFVVYGIVLIYVYYPVLLIWGIVLLVLRYRRKRTAGPRDAVAGVVGSDGSGEGGP